MAYIYTTVCLQRVISGAWLPRYTPGFQMAGFLHAPYHAHSDSRHMGPHTQIDRLPVFPLMMSPMSRPEILRCVSYLVMAEFVAQWSFDFNAGEY